MEWLSYGEDIVLERTLFEWREKISYCIITSYGVDIP